MKWFRTEVNTYISQFTTWEHNDWYNVYERNDWNFEYLLRRDIYLFGLKVWSTLLMREHMPTYAAIAKACTGDTAWFAKDSEVQRTYEKHKKESTDEA